MGIYTKKPVEIEAREFTGYNAEELVAWVGRDAVSLESDGNGFINVFVIQTLEGNMAANVGDFVIKGVKDEFYPCKPDIFEATYDLKED